MAILEVRDLSKRFGGLTAVDQLSFAVEPGEIHGLIGPNGAGKTTTFNLISGFYAPSSGQVLYEGRDISGMRTSAIAALGLVRTFQASVLFHEFTVFENLRVGCHLHARPSFLNALFGGNTAREGEAQAKAEEMLDFFGLAARRDEVVSNLPHGLQRALGVAVALAAEPRLLLLDEPFTGMNPEETRHMMELLRKVQQRGVTLLLVEHDMQAVMGLCGRITVMSFGALLAEGTPEQIRGNPQVIEAYLGTSTHAA
jgi:branched-chain amino acid transport system ATP-binding protein